MGFSTESSSGITVLEEEVMVSGSKYDGAGDPSGVKNVSSIAMISSLLIEGEGDTM